MEGRPLKVLLVEDDKEDYVITRDLLEEVKREIRLDWVSNVDEALERIGSETHDLYLIDYRLGARSGFEVLKALQERTSTAPAIMLTGTIGETLALDAMKAGAADYLVKGQVTPDSLDRSIRYSVARKEYENKLRLSEERLRFALQSADAGTWNLDFITGTSSCSQELLDLYGVTLEEGEQLTLEHLLRNIIDEDREEAKRSVDESFRTGQELHFEGRVKHPTRGIRWISFRGSTQFSGNRPERMAGICLDVTERKRTEEALQEAGRQKDAFLAMLAHELRNPLAAISNAVQYTKTRALPEDLRWASELLERQVHHLIRLIDDLLDLSRITRGKIQLRKERVRLRGCIEESITAALPTIKANNHKFEAKLLETDECIYADPTRIEQAVTNLLINAAKYTESGGTISLIEERVGDRVRIKIKDTGIGIEPEMLANIFELFTQLDHSLDRARGGLGIGLTLVKQIAELHGGSISAHSEGSGKGAEFILELPCIQTLEKEDTRKSQPRNAAAPGPHRILVVDDNADNAQTLALFLKHLGYQVRVAENGFTALNEARTFQPTIVLLDIGLPGMDGYEVARRIKSEDWSGHSYLVAVSGYGQEEDVKRAVNAGFDLHLTKPVDLEALTSIIGERQPTPPLAEPAQHG